MITITIDDNDPFSCEGFDDAHAYLETNDPDGIDQEGKIVTPLPPQQIHSTSGIVTPRSPLEINRERAALYNDMPKEFKEDDDAF